MIVWGGFPILNTGGRYNPTLDSWIATNLAAAPQGRNDYTAIWTGSEMIVWGGWNDQDFFNTGGSYNPGKDSWIATSMTNVPNGRFQHSAVWTGNEMIVWGGWNLNYFNSGAKFDPSTNSWIPTSTTNAPSGRSFSHGSLDRKRNGRLGWSQPHRIEHRRKILRTIRTKPEPDSYPAIESDTEAAPKSTAASMRMLIIELTIGNGGGAFRQACRASKSGRPMARLTHLSPGSRLTTLA
jgi:hypothetical protein